jgi:hypothetical protein
MQFPPDNGLVEVLTAFNVGPDALLGHGGEAWVYALDEERVLRVLHAGAARDKVLASAALAATLMRGHPPFALPELIDIGEIGGRVYAIEKRLQGRPVLEELGRTDDRAGLIEGYLDCSNRLGDLHLDDAPWWGDLIQRPPVRSNSWHGYLLDKAQRSLQTAGPDFAIIDAGRLADDLPVTTQRSFVHLDAFPGNMLAVGSTITAVIDLGATTVAGDRRIDPLASAIYLTPNITPTATDRDRDVASAWLRNAGLANLVDPARRWLAAYWSFATDDLPLHQWCKSVLLG